MVDPAEQSESADEPLACALGADELGARLESIASLGSESLVSHEAKEGCHLLRFRDGAEARRRLEEIVAAESECCPFLELSLVELDDLLVLSISAPRDAQPVADELAAAFTRPT
jgi:hypothetical protein